MKENTLRNINDMLGEDTRSITASSFEFYILLFQGFTGIIAAFIISSLYSTPMGILSLLLLPSMYILLIVQTYARNVDFNNRDNFPTEVRDQGIFSVLSRIFNIFFCGFAELMPNLIYYALFIIFANEVEKGASKTDLYIVIAAIVWSCFSMQLGLFTRPYTHSDQHKSSKILSIATMPQGNDFSSSFFDGNKMMNRDDAEGDIEFHDVWFKYPNSESDWVLKKFNLKIRSGERVGILGDVGTGKSAIIQLLMRFYEPQKGYITIDDMPITHYSIDSVRNCIGYIQQDALLFNTSIMKNISYGRPYANTFEIEDAAKTANAIDFITKLGSENPKESEEISNKDDLTDDTRYSRLNPGFRVIFEDQLSLVQKQRLAIARATITKPQIFLLDSVCRNLDSQSQDSINETLLTATDQHTTVMCSESYKDLNKCHRIAVISDGSVTRELSYNHIVKLAQS